MEIINWGESMIEIGEKKGEVLQQIPFDLSQESIPGRVYHLTLSYAGTIKNPQALFESLSFEFSKRQYRGAHLYYLGIDEDNKCLHLQLSGSPFAWGTVASSLPLIMTASGIVLVGVAIFDVLSSIPGWAWGVLVIGGLLIITAPLMIKRR